MLVGRLAVGQAALAACPVAAAVKHHSTMQILGLGAAPRQPWQQQIRQVETSAWMTGVLPSQVTGPQTAKATVLGTRQQQQHQQQEQQQRRQNQ